MSRTNDISFTLNGLTYKFSMTYHADNPCDQGMMGEFNRWGCCEPELLHVMQRVIKPGMFVIDGGANVGFFTVIMSGLVGKDGKVIAIEPGENNLWKLEQNLKLNKCKNVEIIRRPLWREHENVRFYLSPDPGLNALSHRGAGFKEYDAVTLADYPKVDFIKLDIEGAEQDALMGAGYISCPYIVAELNEQAMGMLKSTQASLRSLMRAYSYKTFVLHKNGVMPTLVPDESRIISLVKNTNILFSSEQSVGKAWPEVVA